MFSMCSELAPRAHIPDTRIPQLMQPCKKLSIEENTFKYLAEILHQHHVGFVNGCNYCRGTEMNCGNVG